MILVRNDGYVMESLYVEEQDRLLSTSYWKKANQNDVVAYCNKLIAKEDKRIKTILKNSQDKKNRILADMAKFINVIGKCDD